MKRIIIFCLCFFIFLSNCFSQYWSFQQPIYADHWIYDALYRLNAEQKNATVLDNAPLPVSELYMNFLQIDREALSDAGKQLYDTTQGFFEEKKSLIDYNNVKFTTSVILNPAVAAKSNNDMDWSYATSYTSEYKNYLANISQNSIYHTGLATVPLFFDFNDTFCFDFESYLGAMPFWGLSKDRVATNITTGKNGGEFLSTPTRAFGSIGKAFDNWGINVQMGMNGLEIGRSKTGSIIYNRAFQTDSFFQLNAYSPKIKYNLDFAQVDIQRYLYIHYFEVIPVNWLKIGVLEGTLVKGPIELRYFNPLVTMHHYFGWRLYKMLGDPNAAKYYGETDYCAYLGISFDFNPCKYLRLYLMYAQNELQEPLERGDDYHLSYPDSLGFQLGAEVTYPFMNGYLLGNFESVYTTPFCYLKQTSDASLVRVRNNMNYPSFGLGQNSSWIGSQFGPDAFALNLSFGYEEMQKWKCELNYLFVAHGTNSLALFDKKVTIDGVEYEAYYPSSMYLQGTDPEITKAMRTYKLTGIIQYTNRIGLSGEYHFLDNLSVSGQFLYSFIFNHRAVENQFAQGVEGTLSVKYTIF